MKTLKNITLLLSIAVVLIIGCNKQTLESVQMTQNEFKSGVIVNSPDEFKKGHVLISEQYLTKHTGLRIADLPSMSKTRTYSTPTVSIISPKNNDSLSGNVTISANASDPTGISSVACYIDNTLLATDVTAPYDFSLATIHYAGGTHTIKVTAKNPSGRSASASIQVIIYNATNGGGGGTTTDITPPNVTITSPVNGSNFDNGATMTLTCSASDNVGVTSVQYFIDGGGLSSFISSPYTFVYSTANLTPGIHTVTATARDAAGNTASNSISITVNTTIIPPTIPSGTYQLATPPVGNQGSEGNCGIFAAVYGVRSIEYYYGQNANSFSYSTNIFSPEFVFDQVKTSDCTNGAGVMETLNFLQNTGVCTWQSMPYSSTNGCSLIPTAAQMAEASLYKISSYSLVPSTDSVAIRTLLNNHHPIMFCLCIDQQFYNANSTFIWKNSTGCLGVSHAVTCVGYDDSKHAYRIMNSWGTGWGDAGFSWIDYTFFPTVSATYVFTETN